MERSVYVLRNGEVICNITTRRSRTEATSLAAPLSPLPLRPPLVFRNRTF